MRTSNMNGLRPLYMLDHTSTFRLVWDLVIVTMNIVNVIFIPIEVSFKPEYSKSGGYIAFDYLFDLCFLFDLILNFRTSYTDEYGDKIFDKKLIAKRYVRTARFVCDVVAII